MKMKMKKGGAFHVSACATTPSPRRSSNASFRRMLDQLTANGFDEALRDGRPYFGPHLVAAQGAPERYVAMLATVESLCRNRSNSLHVLEIGTWAGGSALLWAEGIFRFNGGRGTVVCVDCWEPYVDLEKYPADNPALPALKEMTNAAEAGNIYDLFRHNVRSSPYGRIVSHFRGQSRDLLPFLGDLSFDLVYVDGSHTHAAASYDLHHAKRIVRDGGIVCGDDLELQINLQQVDRAEAFRDHDLEYAFNSKTRSYYHPGVTLAVDDHFTDVTNEAGFFLAQRRKGAFVPLSPAP